MEKMKIKTKKHVTPFMWLGFVVILVYTFSLLFVLAWGAMTALKSVEEFGTITNGNTLGIPRNPTFENFVRAFYEFKLRLSGPGENYAYIEHMFLNSCLYVFGGAFVSIFTRLLVAYAVAKFDFIGKKFLYTTVIVTMVIPIVGSLPSEIKMAHDLGIYDTLIGTYLMKGGFTGMEFLVFYAAFKSVPNTYIVGVGMGVPGMIDSAKGEVVYSNNLGWEHFFISDEVKKQTGLPVKIANDANVAALGETKFGCGKDYNNTVMLTLGTGVGGGIIINGKLFEGNRSAGAELGHSVIVAGGEQCTCGRKGCLEAYASATALIRDTKRAMLADKNSKMWEIGTLDNVTGKTAFDYKDVDDSAKLVVDGYIEKLGVGITNIANEFRPEAVILGGGVCAQGDNLIKPLQEFVNKEIFAGSKGPQVKILTATLGNNAGIFGAVALLI